MQRVLVINGPNLDMLGRREPEVYGNTSLDELERRVVAWGEAMGLAVDTFQSNHEGALIDRIHDAADSADGIVLNGGAFTHYSYAIHDALLAVGLPAVEIHISNIHEREPWRRTSVTAPACVRAIHGRGIDGYRDALAILANRWAVPSETLHYGEHPDQVMDLRIPDNADRGAVLLHGGYWRGEWERDTLETLAVSLHRRGWATANVEYRRTGGGGGWPATSDDVVTAISALQGVDGFPPGPPVVIGHSAGGQIGASAARRAKVGALVLLAPIVDMECLSDHPLGRPNRDAFLGTDDAETVMAASPLRHLTDVPHIIAHDPLDEIAPETATTAYVAALETADIPVVRIDATGIGHFRIVDPNGSVWSSVIELLESSSG